METTPGTGYFAPLAEAKNIALTTFKRDGTPVSTPVHVVADGDVAYVRTYAPSGKLKRIRNNPDVEVAPSTFRGRATGASLRGRARILTGDESDAAGRRIANKYPFLQGRLVPWYHRRKGLTTTHLELVPRSE